MTAIPALKIGFLFYLELFLEAPAGTSCKPLLDLPVQGGGFQGLNGRRKKRLRSETAVSILNLKPPPKSRNQKWFKLTKKTAGTSKKL
jgi:hypothetical protein